MDSRPRHTRPETERHGSAVVTLILAAEGAGGQVHGRARIEDDETLLVLHHNAAKSPKQSIGQTMHVMARMLGLIGH